MALFQFLQVKPGSTLIVIPPVNLYGFNKTHSLEIVLHLFNKADAVYKLILVSAFTEGHQNTGPFDKIFRIKTSI